MELGDWVKSFTDKVGIKQCEGCRNRQKLLNQMSRRGFIGGTTFAAGYAMLSTKRLVAQTVLRPDELPALSLCRAINTVQAQYAEEHDRKYADKAGVMGTYNRGLTNIKQRHEEMVRKANHDSSDATKVWALSLNLDPKSGDIMPGWKWDLAVTANGFVMVVAAIPVQEGEKVAVYATDEEWIIYRADLAEVPKASTLLHAQWLSGGVSWNQHVGEERVTWFGRLLRSIGISLTVFASSSYCATCCQQTAGGQCNAGPPPHPLCGFNCGTPNCIWCWTSCGCICCQWSCGCDGGGSCLHFSCCGAPCHNC